MNYNRKYSLAAGMSIVAMVAQSYAANVYIGGNTSSSSVQYLMEYEWSAGSLTKIAGANPGAVSGIAFGDLNGDGSSDLVVGLTNGNSTVGNIRYYLGSNLTLSPSQSTTYQTGTKSLVVTDLDHDGYADVVAKSGTNLVSLFKGSGTALPSTHTSFIQSGVYNNSAMTTIDATGSGHADYVVMGRTDIYSIEFRKINSAGTGLVTDATIQANSAIQTGAINPVSLLAGHFTSSTGKQDLIAVTNMGTTGDDVVYYQNTGTGFNYAGGLAASGVLTSRLPGAVGDVNGDGRDDAIILTGSNLMVFSFGLDGSTLIKTLIDNISLASLGTAVTCESIDLNGDGRSDVLVGFSNGMLAAYVADSNGILSLDASVDTGQTSMTSIASVAVPEPASALLWGGAGLMSLCLRNRSRRRYR